MADAFSKERWNCAFSAVKEQFNIDELFPEQVEGIKAFFEGKKNVFVSLPTGFGKSLIYQSLPIVADCLYVLVAQALCLLFHHYKR